MYNLKIVILASFCLLLPFRVQAQTKDTTKVSDLLWLKGLWEPVESNNHFFECITSTGAEDSLALVWVTVDDRPLYYVSDGQIVINSSANDSLQIEDARFTQGEKHLQDIVLGPETQKLSGVPLKLTYKSEHSLHFVPTKPWFYLKVQLLRQGNFLYVTYITPRPNDQFVDRTTYSYYKCDCE